MKNATLTKVMPLSFLIIFTLLLPAKAQISDWCKTKKSCDTIRNRYYNIEKDLLDENTWEIRGSNGVLALIRKKTTPLGDEWNIESKLGREIGSIDDKDFIQNLQRTDYYTISIEKDYFGNYTLKDCGVSVGKIKWLYTELLDNLNDDNCTSDNYHYLWDSDDDDRTTNRFITIPNPIEELRKQISLPDPMQELKKNSDLFRRLFKAIKQLLPTGIPIYQTYPPKA